MRATGERVMNLMDIFFVAALFVLYGLLLWFAEIPDGSNETKNGGRA